MGDVALKSHLGEPLVARINVTDVEKSPDTNCFSVTDTSDVPTFKKAFISLKPITDGYQLTINTHDVITEPIVNLHVTYHCDPNFNRDYVLLLDPATLTDDAVSFESTTLTEKKTNDSNKSSSAISNPSAIQKNSDVSNMPAKDTTAKKKTSKKKSPAATSIDEKLMEAYTGKKPVSSKPVTDAVTENNPTKKIDTASVNSKPLLTISGGDVKPNEKTSLPNLALRLETQIDFARAEPPVPLSTTDVMDEVTVMANRLAHLEKQIISLQNKNSQLKNDAELAKKQLSEQKSLWLRNFLIAISLGAFLAFAEWLRRKLVRDHLNKEQDHWFDHSEEVPITVEPAESATNETNHAKNSILDDPFFEDTIYGHSTGLDTLIANTSSMTNESINEQDNILESANVFIEHGRPNLAIQLLQDHLSEFPSESPKVWLKLLNLLATDGSEAEYDLALNECAQHYNIKMPSFAEAKSRDYSSIEDFPNIVARLKDAWNSPVAVGFLNDLIYNQQAQPIEGFGRETFDELFLLKQIAEQTSPGALKDRKTFYPPATIKPVIDSMKFNNATFGDDNQLDDTKTPDRMSLSDEDLLVEAARKDSKILADELSASIENSPFQTLPSYEVDTFDTLPDFDRELGTKDAGIANEDIDLDLAQNKVDTESNTASNSTDNNTLMESVPNVQASEIDFSQHLQELAQMQDAENDTLQSAAAPTTGKKNHKKKNTNESNLIEWDLPEIK